MSRSEALPKNLELTPERKAKIEEQQQLLREQAMARGRLTPEAQRVQLGMAHERAALSDVAMLTGEKHKVRTSAPLRTAMAKHAEGLALQGRYDEAARHAPTKELQLHYFQLWQAVWRDDETTCPCEPFQDGELSLTHDHVSEEVLSLKHNRIMPAIRCNCCGFVNVRLLTPELQERQRLQMEAQKAMHGYASADLKHNAAQLLNTLRDRQVLKRR